MTSSRCRVLLTVRQPQGLKPWTPEALLLQVSGPTPPILGGGPHDLEWLRFQSPLCPVSHPKTSQQGLLVPNKHSNAPQLALIPVLGWPWNTASCFFTTSSFSTIPLVCKNAVSSSIPWDNLAQYKPMWALWFLAKYENVLPFLQSPWCTRRGGGRRGKTTPSSAQCPSGTSASFCSPGRNFPLIGLPFSLGGKRARTGSCRRGLCADSAVVSSGKNKK